MKLPLPFSKKEFERLEELRKLEVARLRRLEFASHEHKRQQTEVVLAIVDKMFEYINILDYNKYSRNTCKYGNSEDTQDVCEKRFNNTLANYSSNGNCCKSCNSVILSKLYVQN